MNIFINTRPMGKAMPNIDISNVHLPLLAIMPFENLTDVENEHLATFINGKIATVVVVSVETVRCAINFLKQHGIYHASDLAHRPTLIAVGQPTKDALVQFGFDVITPAEFGLPMSNEGMIQLPILANLNQNDHIMIWRGVGGRRLLDDTLAQRGVRVLPIEFYQRQAPNDIAKQFEHFYQNLPSNAHLYVLISSGMSLDIWVDFDKKTHATTFLALGERLTQLTTQHYPNCPVHRIDDMSQTTLSTILHSIININQ